MWLSWWLACTIEKSKVLWNFFFEPWGNPNLHGAFCHGAFLHGVFLHETFLHGTFLHGNLGRWLACYAGTLVYQRTNMLPALNSFSVAISASKKASNGTWITTVWHWLNWRSQGCLNVVQIASTEGGRLDYKAWLTTNSVSVLLRLWFSFKDLHNLCVS